MQITIPGTQQVIDIDEIGRQCIHLKSVRRQGLHYLSNPRSTPMLVKDIHPQEAWDILASLPNAKLIDVRTSAEMLFVGAPDLSSINKTLHHIEWQCYPDMSYNEKFIFFVIEGLHARLDSHLIFICRSGARSNMAAHTFAQMGYNNLYNVSSGFEGPPNEHGHRSTVSGWKHSNLPWRQT